MVDAQGSARVAGPEPGSGSGDALPASFGQNKREFPREEFEQELLGILMLESENVDQVRHVLRAEHFAFVEHQEIYTEMCRLRDDGQAANPNTMRHWADRYDGLKDMKPYAGARYLVFCVMSQVGWLKPLDGARELVTQANIDAAYAAADDLRKNLETGGTPKTAVARAKASLDDIVDPGGAEPRGMADILEAARRATERAASGQRETETGLRLVDEATGGLHRGELICLGGATGNGKSLLAQGMAGNIMRRGGTVFLKNVELSEAQIGHRFVAAESGIPYIDLRKGNITEAQRPIYEAARARVNDWSLLTYSGFGGTVAELKAAVKKAQENREIDLVIVDYLQLIEPEARYLGNKVAEVEQVSNSLKVMAVDLDVPVLALSQLARGVKERVDKRPVLNDLRWSGSIEQDSDVVLLLHYEHYYDPDSPKNQLEISIAKNRNGATKAGKIYAEMHTGAIGNLELTDYGA